MAKRQQPNGLARRVLLAPNLVARAAARAAGERERGVDAVASRARCARASCARWWTAATTPLHAEIWMLRQPQAVRESYVREVLEPALRR